MKAITTKRAAVLDMLRAGAVIDEAARAAGVSVRTVHDWASKDPDFASLKAEAMKNRGRTVTERQVVEWVDQHKAIQAHLLAIEADLLQVAAPALVGDDDAKRREAELKAQKAKLSDRVAQLTVAITSAEQHLAKDRAREAEEDRQGAQKEADDLGQQQRAAAARIDAAFCEIESAWGEFATIAGKRQSAARRAGRSARAAYDRMLVQAAFVAAPSAATALGLDRMLLSRRARSLAETVS